MKSLTIPLILFCLQVSAQSTLGITGIPDTSFTNYSAYHKAKKIHPKIKLVKEKSSARVVEKKNITYCSIGNRNLFLDAFLPKKKRKSPAVVIVHGGGWRSGSRTQHYPLAQRLAEKGYVCFTPEYRLSSEALYPAAVYDLKAAVRWIRKNASEYQVDTSRIAVLGFSAGGELAAFMGVTNNNKRYEGSDYAGEFSSKVNAVVDIDGTLSFVHPESGEGDDRKGPSAATYWFGYSKLENPDLWKEASPLNHAGPDTPPFLFLNSAVDRMHAGRDDFRKILDSNGIYSEVHTFPNSPHTFILFEPWFTPSVNYIHSFLQKVF